MQRSKRRSKITQVTENAPPRLADVPRPIHPPESRRTSQFFHDTPLITAFRHFRSRGNGESHRHPAWQSYISYVETAARSGDEDMLRVFRAYQSFTKQEKLDHSPEQLCEIAQITPDELIGKVCQWIWKLKSPESSVVCALAHPPVMDRIARDAQKSNNVRSQELFLRATGTLPDKRGTSLGPAVNINIGGNGPDGAVVDSGAGTLPGLRSPSGILPSMDEDMVETTRALSVAPLTLSREDDVQP